MRAAACIEVARHRGRDVLVDVRSEPPLTIRETPERVLIAGSAASPVGGDELSLRVTVGPDARLALGTVAATMAWPGPTGALSTTTVDAFVADGGHLAWAPEPLVAVARCDHRAATRVSLAPTATAWIVEEIVLGRAGEPSGRLDLAWRVERGGTPLLHRVERLGPDVPGWGSATLTAGHRHLLTALSVGPTARSDDGPSTSVTPAGAAAHLRLADDAHLLLIAAADRVTAHQLLTEQMRIPQIRPCSGR